MAEPTTPDPALEEPRQEYFDNEATGIEIEETEPEHD